MLPPRPGPGDPALGAVDGWHHINRALLFGIEAVGGQSGVAKPAQPSLDELLVAEDKQYGCPGDDRCTVDQLRLVFSRTKCRCKSR